MPLERDQQFGEHQSIDIVKSQRLPKEGNARINKVSTMRPGLAKILRTYVFQDILNVLKVTFI